MWQRGLLGLALVFALIDAVCLSNWRPALDPTQSGWLGMTSDIGHEGRWGRVTAVTAGGPAEHAGLVVGDRVRFDRVGDGLGNHVLRVGEPLKLSVRDGAGHERRAVMVPQRNPDFNIGQYAFSYLAGWGARLLALFIGVVLALRRPESAMVRALALVLITNSVFGLYFLPSGLLADWSDVTGAAVYAVQVLAPLFVALALPEERPFWRLPAVRATFVAATVGVILIQCQFAAFRRGWLPVGWVDSMQPLSSFFLNQTPLNPTDFVLYMTMGLFWLAWRASVGVSRQRTGWIALALCSTVVVNLGLTVLELTPMRQMVDRIRYQLWDGAFLVSTIALAWALLRHRMFNLGLVIQRTLVFSLVGTLVLMTVGLAKWLAEALLRAVGGEHTWLYDAIVAMTVVAVFAFLQRHAVDRVQRFVFRSWYAAADKLQAFIDRAPHVTVSDVLQGRFVEAVDAFCGAQGSALYRADAEGQLLCANATLDGATKCIDVNDELAIELRHGSRCVDLTRLTEAPKGDWAFPMQIRGAVYGCLVVSARADGVTYRPEELAQLEDSTYRIGIALEGLRTADLERRLAIRTGDRSTPLPGIR